MNVTVAAPVAPQSSERAVKSWLQVTAPQLSSAAAPPLLASQAFSSAALPAPSHSTVWSAAAVVMIGAIVSCTRMTWSASAALPAQSSARQRRVIVRSCGQPPAVSVSL